MYRTFAEIAGGGSMVEVNRAAAVERRVQVDRSKGGQHGAWRSFRMPSRPEVLESLLSKVGQEPIGVLEPACRGSELSGAPQIVLHHELEQLRIIDNLLPHASHRILPRRLHSGNRLLC